MRIILILLSLATLVLIGWIGTSALKNTPTIPSNNSQNSTNISSVDNVTLDLVKTNEQLKYQVEELNKKVDQLSGVTPAVVNTNVVANPNNSGSTATSEIIPISAKFLSKILPTIEPTKVENAGIFDLRIFDQTFYSTYKDEKFGITIVASMLPYDNFLKNFQSIDKSIYTVNVTKTFPFDSFYVNPGKADASVRIVMKVEAQTLLISLPKSKFNTLKELILKTK